MKLDDTIPLPIKSRDTKGRGDKYGFKAIHMNKKARKSKKLLHYKEMGTLEVTKAEPAATPQPTPSPTKYLEESTCLMTYLVVSMQTGARVRQEGRDSNQLTSCSTTSSGS